MTSNYIKRTIFQAKDERSGSIPNIKIQVQKCAEPNVGHGKKRILDLSDSSSTESKRVRYDCGSSSFGNITMSSPRSSPKKRNIASDRLNKLRTQLKQNLNDPNKANVVPYIKSDDKASNVLENRSLPNLHQSPQSNKWIKDDMPQNLHGKAIRVLENRSIPNFREIGLDTSKTGIVSVKHVTSPKKNIVLENRTVPNSFETEPQTSKSNLLWIKNDTLPKRNIVLENRSLPNLHEIEPESSKSNRLWVKNNTSSKKNIANSRMQRIKENLQKLMDADNSQSKSDDYTKASTVNECFNFSLPNEVLSKPLTSSLSQSYSYSKIDNVSKTALNSEGDEPDDNFCSNKAYTSFSCSDSPQTSNIDKHLNYSVIGDTSSGHTKPGREKLYSETSHISPDKNLNEDKDKENSYRNTVNVENSVYTEKSLNKTISNYKSDYSRDLGENCSTVKQYIEFEEVERYEPQFVTSKKYCETSNRFHPYSNISDRLKVHKPGEDMVESNNRVHTPVTKTALNKFSTPVDESNLSRSIDNSIASPIEWPKEVNSVSSFERGQREYLEDRNSDDDYQVMDWADIDLEKMNRARMSSVNSPSSQRTTELYGIFSYNEDSSGLNKDNSGKNEPFNYSNQNSGSKADDVISWSSGRTEPLDPAFDVPIRKQSVSYSPHSVVSDHDDSKDVYIIVDTNVLLSSLSKVKDIIKLEISGSIRLYVYLPWMVVIELDYLKDTSKQKKIKDHANEAIKFINSSLSEPNSRVVGQNVYDVAKQKNVGPGPDDSIIACCLFALEKYKNVMLLTNDVNLRNKSLINGVTACSVNEVIPKIMTKIGKNNKFQKILHKMSSVCSSVICKCTKDSYGEVWSKMDMLSSPPWSLQECIKRFKKYWAAVFRELLFKQFIKTIDNLYVLLKKNAYICDDSEKFNDFMKLCLDLLIFLKDIESCRDIVMSTILELQKM